MPTFRIRAQWWGPDGAQLGVADDTVEAADACEAAAHAVPFERTVGQFTHGSVRIELVPPKGEE